MTIPPGLAKFGAKYGIYIGIALLVAAVLGLTYCQGQKAGKSGEVVKSQARTIKVQNEVAGANENAAEARVADATRAAKQERELHDALKSTSDPARARVLRGCIILRQQGRDTENIPACRRP